MSKSRKVSQEEKYTIVTDCIENDDNYGQWLKNIMSAINKYAIGPSHSRNKGKHD